MPNIGDKVRLVGIGWDHYGSGVQENDVATVTEVIDGNDNTIEITVHGLTALAWHNPNRVFDYEPIVAKTPQEIAQAVLNNHAIRPTFRRDGEQIQKLIVEAIKLDREER